MSSRWLRVALAAAIWTLVYNLAWGAAWFAFMRREWTTAAAAIGKPMPWTPGVWTAAIVMSLFLGVATMAYATSQPRAQRKNAAAFGGVGMWILFSLGMAGWAIPESYSLRVVSLDSAVNLAAILVASLAGVGVLTFALARRDSTRNSADETPD
jgi:hypothetical protein